jgi:two-component system, cell cycle response regulator CpdR
MAHILLAEDDLAMCRFLEQALGKAGHCVTAKHDGLQALAAIDGPDHFDALVADIVMPGMDGIELAQVASKKRPGMKVMFITGFAAVAVGAQAQQANARVLSKPFHLNDLVVQLESLLAE